MDALIHPAPPLLCHGRAKDECVKHGFHTVHFNAWLPYAHHCKDRDPFDEYDSNGALSKYVQRLQSFACLVAMYPVVKDAMCKPGESVLNEAIQTRVGEGAQFSIVTMKPRSHGVEVKSTLIRCETVTVD